MNLVLSSKSDRKWSKLAKTNIASPEKRIYVAFGV